MPDDDPRLPWDEPGMVPDRVDGGDVPADEDESAPAGDVPADEGSGAAEGPAATGDVPADEDESEPAGDVPADEGSGADEAPGAAGDVAANRGDGAPTEASPARLGSVPAEDASLRGRAEMTDPSRPVAMGPGRRPTEPVASPESARTEARLAHIHLRTSMHALARAELETLAAHGSLDVPALADLAEVRWRTGDLVGAGEAADAYVEAGGDDLVVLCVAAEAAAAAGRMAAARHLAARVLARGRDRIDDLFAGQPRSNVWPELGTAAPSAAVAGAPAPAARPAPESASPILAASASSDLADAQARIARGDLAGIATRLALVLRVQPVLAPAILSVADQALRAPGAAPEAASLHLVRGDAYRLMGRETLAGEAFQQSGRALRSARRPEG